jgi:hypothetical protein
MTDSARPTTLWTREFWSAILNRRSSLSRQGNEVDLLGWKVRVAWEDGGRRGTIYLHPRNVLSTEFDCRMFVFPTLNPRKQARLLLRQLTTLDTPRRTRA